MVKISANNYKYLQAKDYLNEGKYREAVECFQRAIDVTPKMARDLIQACRDRNVDCIVAPYEGIVTKLSLDNLDRL